jgi:small subunit ribosomal protein S8
MSDLINDGLVAIKNAEYAGKQETSIFASNLLEKILQIMQKQGYIEYKRVPSNSGDIFKIKLLHTLNKCGAIKPRFAVKKHEYEKWEQRYLPARNFGTLIVSTPLGVMTHEEAKAKQIGGRLIAYVY